MRILTIISIWLGIAVVCCAQIASDSTPQDTPSIKPLDVDSEKIGHMVDFIMALQEKDDAKAAALLMNVLKYDPDGEMPLLMLLKKCSDPEILKTYKPQLVELAQAHPDSLKLNLAVQLFANDDVPVKDLAAMGLAGINSVDDPAKLSEQNQSVLAKLAEITAELLVREMRSAEAEALFEKLIVFESMQKDVQFLQAAAKFYAAAAKTPELSEAKLDLYNRRQSQILQLIDKYFKNPKGLAMVLQTAGIYQQLGAYPQAIRLVEEQLHKQPNNQRLMEALGNLWYLSGHYQEALKIRRELARRYPEVLNYLNAYVETLLFTGDAQAAIGELKTLHEKNPNDQYYKYMLGMAYYYGRQYRNVIGLLEGFKDFAALRMLVTSYTHLKEFDKALALMKSAENSKRKDFIIDFNFYMMYLTIGEKSKREDIIRECAETIRQKFGWDSPEIANAVGYTYADLGIELDLAEKLIRRALGEMPDNVAILDSMAWVLYRRGDAKSARHYIEQAIKLSGDDLDGVIADHAGDIYHMLGRTDLAARYWKKALRLGGDIEPGEVREKLKIAEDELAFE